MTKKKGFAAVAAVFCALFAFACVTLGSVAPAQAQPAYPEFEQPNCQGAPHFDPVPCAHPYDLSFVDQATGECKMCQPGFAAFKSPDCQGPVHFDPQPCAHPDDLSFKVPGGQCLSCQ